MSKSEQDKNFLQGDGCELFYQPKVRLSDGKITGMEALLRVKDPVRPGFYMDTETYIDAAEKSGKIIGLGKWVFLRACRDLAHLRQLGGTDLRMSINISGRQTQDKKLVGFVASTMSDFNLPADCLEMEITESWQALEGCIELIIALRALGLRVVIDDFGTGYSTLAAMKRLPVDGIKIDKAFVQEPECPTSNAILHFVVMLARHLNLEITAEGVETRQHNSMLRAMGCDIGQGWLYGRPMPLERFKQALSGGVYPKIPAFSEPLPPLSLLHANQQG